MNGSSHCSSANYKLRGVWKTQSKGAPNGQAYGRPWSGCKTYGGVFAVRHQIKKINIRLLDNFGLFAVGDMLVSFASTALTVFCCYLGAQRPYKGLK